MYIPSQGLFAKAASAVVNLTKYAAHDFYQTLGNFTQHLVDCTTPHTEKSLTAGIPFVLVWRVAGSRVELASQNCSSQELSWLYKNLCPRSRLMKELRSLLASDSLSRRVDLTAPKLTRLPPIESFKTCFFSDGGVCLNYKILSKADHVSNNGKTRGLLTVFMPSDAGVQHFIQCYENHFLPNLHDELHLENNEFREPSRLVSEEQYLSLPETHSSFAFLQSVLETVSNRINSRLSEVSARPANKIKFRATFLFRTSERRNRNEKQYKYVFTRSQIQDLKKTRLSQVARGKLLASFENLAGIERLAPRRREKIYRWLQFQDKSRNVYDLLSRGQWYGKKSFVSYVGSLSPNQSMYISDWRIWYSPKNLFRTPKEKSLFHEWLDEEDTDFELDSRTEPIDRLLRSEIEKFHFGLQSMFMVPVYAAKDQSPAAVVQISSTELKPEERIHDLLVLGFVHNEILGYLRADLLQEQLSERKRYDQFVDLAHLFTHAGTKLLSTPMHNTLTRFSNAIRDGRFNADKIDRWSIADGLFTSKTLETTLGALTRFEWTDKNKLLGSEKVPLQSISSAEPTGRFMARGVDWTKVKQELETFLETAFFRHFWNVCHDPRYARFETYFRQDEIDVSEMVSMDIRFPPLIPRTLGHTDLMVMHLSNLVENAIESFDLAKSALGWEKNNRPLWYIKFVCQLSEESASGHEPGWLFVTVSNNSRPTTKERALLQELGKIFDDIACNRIDSFLRTLRIKMRHRYFTSKSGGSHGWALLEFASYLRRLEVRRAGRMIRSGRIALRKDLSSEVTFDLLLPVLIAPGEYPHYLEYPEDIAE